MNGSCSGQGARRSICQIGLSILQIAHSEAMPRAGGSRALEDEKMLASSLRFYRVGAFGYRFKSAATSNEQIRQVVCPTSCACRTDGCVQISRSPDPHRGRASATDSRRLAKATSRMDRARRRVSHVRFLRGAPEAAPQNLCPVGPGRSCLTLFPI